MVLLILKEASAKPIASFTSRDITRYIFLFVVLKIQVLDIKKIHVIVIVNLWQHEYM